MAAFYQKSVCTIDDLKISYCNTISKPFCIREKTCFIINYQPLFISLTHALISIITGSLIGEKRELPKRKSRAIKGKMSQDPKTYQLELLPIQQCLQCSKVFINSESLASHLMSECVKTEEMEGIRHRLHKAVGPARKTRRRCQVCYQQYRETLTTKEACRKTRQVTTYCGDCFNKPFMCLECFNKVH